MEEKTLTMCRLEPFTFSAGEQQFYQERGMSDRSGCSPAARYEKLIETAAAAAAAAQVAAGARGGGGGSYDRW